MTQAFSAAESDVDGIVSALSADLARDLGGLRFPNPERWNLVGVEPRTFRRRVPVATFSLGSRTLCFIVTPTDPTEPAYKRTKRHDVVYFSEDVADHEQGAIYARDRAMIDGFAAWLALRDGSR